MKKIAILTASGFALLGSSFAAEQKSENDCNLLRAEVTKEVASAKGDILEIVNRQVAASPDCSCEVVKAAIAASDASPELVSAIVETAIGQAPENARLIAQCAIAVAPDALKQVQAVMAKLDKNAGESKYTPKEPYSPKDIDKGGISPQTQTSPLDFPQGTDPGANPPQVSLPPFFMPPVAPPIVGITPPDVTNVTP